MMSPITKFYLDLKKKKNVKFLGNTEDTKRGNIQEILYM